MLKRINKRLLIIFIITLIGGLLRFYQLQNFPVQLSHDEVTQLYDAISIAQTGRDIYGNFLPTMFPSVNDYKSPFYTYITALTYLILGNKDIIIRLPGAVFGTLLIPAVFFLVWRIFKKDSIANLAALFTAISPFEIFFSRKSFENIPGIFFMAVGFSALYIFLERREQLKWFYLASGFLAVGMYTYFSHAVIIPLLFLIFLFIYRQEFLPIIQKIKFPIILWLLLIIPLLIVVFTNSDSRYRSQTVFVTKDINFGKVADFGKSENELISKFNYMKTFIDFSFDRYLYQFNPTYLFTNGLDLTNQGPLGMGLLFSFQLPFLLLGLVYLLKRKELGRETQFLAALVLIGMIPSGLTFEEHSPHRSIMVFTVLDIISAVGLYYFIQLVKDRFNQRFTVGILVAILFLFIFQLVYFIHVYFVNYSFEKSQHLHYPFKEVALFAWSEYDNHDQIVFDPLFGQAAPVIGTGAHYYLGYYGNYSPAKMQQEYRFGDKPREVLFDKFSIRKIEWNEDIHLKNTLLILSPWSFNPKILPEIQDKIIKTFYFYDHQIAFYAVKT